MESTHDLRNRLLNEFPGKMENEQAFIMQFIMKEAQNGKSPPKLEVIQQVITSMISDGIFERKGSLLILKSNPIISIKTQNEMSEEEEEDQTHFFNPIDLPKSHQHILMGFQGKYENKAALIMNIIMKEAEIGNIPPSKEELEEAIQNLLEKGMLEEKGTLLIKKI